MRILIVRLSSLGDIIHNLPMVDDLRAKFPKARIDWVCEANFATIVQQYQGIHTVISMEWRKWRKNPWRYRKELNAFYKKLTDFEYDYIIDPQGLIKSALVAFLARWRPHPIADNFLSLRPWQFFRQKRAKVIGYANQTRQSSYEKPAKWLYTKAHLMPYEIHALDRARLLAAKEFQYESELEESKTLPSFSFKPFHSASQLQYFNQTKKIPYIILFHGSSSRKKFWPNAEWQLLIHLLHKKYPNHYILLPHGNDEEQLQALNIQKICLQQAEYFKSHSENPNIHINLNTYLKVLPRISLLNMYELIQNAKGVIGLDTGLTHLSSALGVPTISIYINDIRWRVGAYWQHNTKSVHVNDLMHDHEMRLLYQKLFFNQKTKNIHQVEKNAKNIRETKNTSQVDALIKSTSTENQWLENKKTAEKIKKLEKTTKSYSLKKPNRQHQKILPAKVVAYLFNQILG